MGEGFLPSQYDASAITSHLNAMFSKDGIRQTRTRFLVLKAMYPILLEYKENEVHNSKRKRSLRYAAWLLMSDIDFANVDKPYPAKNFRAWLRWLTWLERHTPADVAVTVDGGQLNAEKPAEAILKTLRRALEDSDDNDVTVAFKWDPPPPGGKELVVITRRQPPAYEIRVQSRPADDLPTTIGDNEDDEFPPKPATPKSGAD
jgi:hypothetical protein